MEFCGQPSRMRRGRLRVCCRAWGLRGLISSRGVVWGGHSCPPAFEVDFRSSSLPDHRRTKIKVNFKGGGQECPPHTVTAPHGYWISVGPLVGSSSGTI